jgi:stage III sporulation protein AF
MIIIKEWVRNIFMIVVAISFVEIILPSGSMKKYLRFIFATIMLAVIISPLAEILLEEREVSVFQPGAFSAAGQAAEADLTDRYMSYNIDMTGIYKNKVEEKVKDVLAVNFQDLEVKAVSLSLDERPLEQGGGYISYIEVLVTGAADRKLIQEKLAQEIGISADKITVSVND